MGYQYRPERLGPGNGAAGSIYYPIEFTNTSSVACTLYGYPGVSFVTAPGSQAGAAATEDPTYPRALVTLAPKATACTSTSVQILSVQTVRPGNG